MIDDLYRRTYEFVRGMLSIRTRRRIAHRRVLGRMAGAHSRALPNVLIIGAQRCGTSSLYKYLQQHPDVGTSLRKEIEYFSFYFDRGERWYRAHFPRRRAIESGKIKAVVEATPDYLFDLRCAERAAACVPDAKIVVLLRDPVERAFSQYQHNRRASHEHLSFPEAVAEEERRVGEHLAQLALDPTLPFPRLLGRYSYFGRGLYARQLRPWFERFPRERFHFISSNDLYAQPAVTFAALVDFLGLSRWSPAHFENHSYDRQRPAKPKDTLDEATRTLLVERYREPNLELESLLGRRYEWCLPRARTGTTAR